MPQRPLAPLFFPPGYAAFPAPGKRGALPRPDHGEPPPPPGSGLHGHGLPPPCGRLHLRSQTRRVLLESCVRPGNPPPALRRTPPLRPRTAAPPPTGPAGTSSANKWFRQSPGSPSPAPRAPSPGRTSGPAGRREAVPPAPSSTSPEGGPAPLRPPAPASRPVQSGTGRRGPAPTARHPSPPASPSARHPPFLPNPSRPQPGSALRRPALQTRSTESRRTNPEPHAAFQNPVFV